MKKWLLLLLMPVGFFFAWYDNPLYVSGIVSRSVGQGIGSLVFLGGFGIAVVLLIMWLIDYAKKKE